MEDPKKEKMQRQVDDFTALAMHLMHSQETSRKTVELIGAYEDPYLSVPNAAMTIVDQAENIMKEAGVQNIPLEVKFETGNAIIGDILEIGQYKYKWDLSDQDIGQLTQDAHQEYITRGLNNGTIDIMELQEKAEPMMPEGIRKEAEMAMQKEGVPPVPDQRAIIAAQRMKGGK